MVLPSSALALSDFSWSGATPLGSGATNWSNPTNWVQDGAPSGAVGRLSFPALSTSACSSKPASVACYQSYNDVSGLNVDSVSVDDGAPYYLSGNAITLGAGGLTAAPSPGDRAIASSPNVQVPMTLAASQTWSITGGSGNQQLAIAAPVTGSTQPLTIKLSARATLGLYADDEVGAVSATSTGTPPSTVQLGSPQNPGSLNATDGNPVSFSGGVGLVADSGKIGPLSMRGGQIQVGAPVQPGTLAVNGGATLDAASGLATYIHQSGTSAGTDFSQLRATGHVDLGNARLVLGGYRFVGEVRSCPVLTPGDVDALVTTTGSLTGTFAGVPDGTTIPLDCLGATGTAPTVKINYTTHTVAATVQSSAGTPTTTTLSASPASPVTNQTVTLTATIAADSGAPSGTVEFDNGKAIGGCADQLVAADGSSYTATCQTAFTASSSPEALTAVFKPASGSGLQGSTSALVRLTVSSNPTTTRLSVSEPTPAVGENATFAATVTPKDAGAVVPSGLVRFLDSGTVIDGCAEQPLTAGASSSTASCTLSYQAVGSHSIVAAYLGDGNFSASTSSPSQAVVGQSPAPSNISKPTITGKPYRGRTLTESHGIWSNSPTSYIYQWERCHASGAACLPIVGATAQTYKLTAADVRHRIRVQESATNTGGTSAPSTSAATAVVRKHRRKRDRWCEQAGGCGADRHR